MVDRINSDISSNNCHLSFSLSSKSVFLSEPVSVVSAADLVGASALQRCPQDIRALFP